MTGHGLLYDPDTAVRSLCACPHMASAIERVGPCRLETNRGLTLYAALMRSIVYQQLSGRAAGAIYRKVRGLFRTATPRPAEAIEISYDAFRGAGLSNAKTLAVQDLTAKTLGGSLPSRRRLSRMDDEAVIEALTQVRGVGRWTAEMILLFYLGRPDVFPVGDLGVRKGISLVYGADRVLEPEELEPFGDRWRPYRSVGSWYMWRILDVETP